jgi:hypothetical protein
MSYQILDLPWEEYIKPGFLGSSALHAWHAQECGKEAWADRYLSGGYGKSSATPAMVAGSALDLWLTGGHVAFDAKYVKVPAGIDFRTNEWKAWKAANAGKESLDATTFAQIEEAVRRASNAIAIIGEGDQPQYQATIRGDVAGVQVQTRPDILFPGAKWFRDLKYVNSGSFVGFDRHFVGSRYLIQAALFAGLTDFDYRVSFLLVESGTMSPRIRDVEIPERVLRAGWRRVESICANIRESMDSPLGLNDLPVFDILDLPAWAEKEIDA